MMNKGFISLLLFLIIGGCATAGTANHHLAQIPAIGQEPTLGTIDLGHYSIPPLSDLSTRINIRAVAAIDPNSPARQALIRQGIRFEAPFTGVCLNSAAEAVIEASVGEQIRTAQNDSHQAQETLGAQAIRDLQIMQSNANTLRAFYQAHVRDGVIALEGANNTIIALQHAGSSSIWQTIGWTAVGLVVGAVVTGVIMIFR